MKKEDKFKIYVKLQDVVVKAFERTLVDLGITEGSTLCDVYRMRCRDYFKEELDKVKL